jgi:hypothetical protein
MARKSNPNKADKVQPALAPQVHEYLEQLVVLGGYGNTKTEVARYLIHREIDDLIRAKVLPHKAS